MAPVYSRPRMPYTRAIQVTVRWDLITRVIAFDIEFQDVMDVVTGRRWSRIGRISVVNEHGQVIFDVFVYYPEEENLRKILPGAHRRLGVYWDDIKASSGAVHVNAVEANLARIIERAEIVVGHSINGDIDACKEGMFDGVQMRDTQKHEQYRRWGIGRQRLPRLKILAKEELGIEGLQADEHSSVEDAKATMALYQKRKEQIEAEQGTRVHTTSPIVTGSGSDAVNSGQQEQKSTSSEQSPSPEADQQATSLTGPRMSTSTTPATVAASGDANDTKSPDRSSFVPPHRRPRTPPTGITSPNTAVSLGESFGNSPGSPSAKIAATKTISPPKTSTPPKTGTPTKTSIPLKTSNTPKASIPLKTNTLKMNALLKTNSSVKTNESQKPSITNKFNAAGKINNSSKTYKTHTNSPAQKTNVAPKTEIKTKPGIPAMTKSKIEQSRNSIEAPPRGIWSTAKRLATGEELVAARMAA